MFFTLRTRRHNDTQTSSRDHRHASAHSSRRAHLVTAVPLLLWLAACAKPVEQEVTGRLSSASGTTAGAQLRLYESGICSGNYVKTSTNKNGEFSFRTNTVSSATSKVKQELTLCQKRDAFWQVLWTSAHPGGATRIELTCSVQDRKEKGECETRFNYGA